MTIATSVYVSGSDTITEYTVHPPGFSFNSVDTGVETVTKNSASDNIVAGATVQVLSTTSAGETWGFLQGFANNSGAYRLGVATANALSGTTTMTIARYQRTALPTSTHFKTTCPNVAFDNFASSRGKLHYLSNVGPYRQVVKPSAEIWAFNQDIFFSTTAGITTYTNSYVTASAGTNWGYAGYASIVVGGGQTSGFIINPSSQNGLSTLSRSYRASKTAGLETFQDATLYQPGVTVYRNGAKTSYGAFDSALRPIVAGAVISCDNTTSPRTYKILTGPENEDLGFNEIDLSFIDNGVSPYSARVKRVIFSRYVASYTRIHVVAYSIYGVNDLTRVLYSCPDIALDVDLPAPLGNCRVVWAAGRADSDNLVSLNPMLTRRTTTTAPETGMLRMNRGRPGPFDVYFPNEQRAEFSISGSAQPYQTNEVGTAMGSNAAIRGFSAPNALAVIAGSTAGVTWGWSRFNWGTATWSALSSGNAMSYNGSGEWNATLTDPPGIARTDAALLRIDRAFASGSATATFFVFTGTLTDKIEIWPYDCPAVNVSGLATHTDCRWVGHVGWRCPEIAIPAITWGTASASWSAGLLTMSNGVKPTFTPSISVGDSAADRTWKAVRYQLQAGDYVNNYVLDNSFSNTVFWYDRKAGSPISVRLSTSDNTNSLVTNPQGTGTPTTVRINAWQVYFAASDVGPLAYCREITGLSVTIP